MWDIIFKIIEKDEGVKFRILVSAAIISILITGLNNIKLITDNLTEFSIFEFLLDDSMLYVYITFVFFLFVLKLIMFSALTTTLSQEILDLSIALNKVNILKKKILSKEHQKNTHLDIWNIKKEIKNLGKEIKVSFIKHSKMMFELMIYISLSILIIVLILNSKLEDLNVKCVNSIYMILLLGIILLLYYTQFHSEKSSYIQYHRIIEDKKEKIEIYKINNLFK